MEVFWLKNNCQFFFRPESSFYKQFSVRTHYLICLKYFFHIITKLLSPDQMRMGQIRNIQLVKKL